jgi:hypothetical protein
MTTVHEKHPPCPRCGKAMYKTSAVGKPSRKSDPYAFCRNDKCKYSIYKGSKAEREKVSSAAKQSVVEKHDQPKETKAEPLKTKRRARPASEAATPPEPFVIAETRAKVKLVLARAIPEETPKVAIGLMLAVLNHELGSYEAANSIIRQYQLGQLFGFEEFEKKSK